MRFQSRNYTFEFSEFCWGSLENSARDHGRCEKPRRQTRSNMRSEQGGYREPLSVDRSLAAARAQLGGAARRLGWGRSFKKPFVG